MSVLSDILQKIIDKPIPGIPLDPRLILLTRLLIEDFEGGGSSSSGDVPDASEYQAGIVRLATEAEALAGELTNAAITPATLAAVIEAGGGSGGGDDSFLYALIF